MASKMIGIAISATELRLARAGKTASARVPQGLVVEGRVTDPVAMGSLIRDTMAARGIRGKACSLVLPPQIVAARHLSLPVMNQAELKLNLPFEFRDILPGERTDYDYDYIVLSMSESTMELYAAAALRCAVEDYRHILKTAGLTLKTATPAEMAWRDLIRSTPGLPDTLGVLEPGQNGLRLTIFSGGEFVTGKEIPCSAQGPTETAEAIRRALNFYNFSLSPGEPPLQDLYLSSIPKLCLPGAIAGINIHPASRLTDGAAAGAALQREPQTNQAARGVVSADKQTMNLVRPQTEFDHRKMLPFVAVLGAGLLIFAKLGILNPLEEKARAYNALSARQEQLTQANARLLEYEELEQDHIRYSDSLMTETERSLVSRTEILALVESAIAPKAKIENFTVNNNILTMNLSGITLEEAGGMIAALEACTPVQQAGILSATADDGKQAHILISVTLAEVEGGGQND